MGSATQGSSYHVSVKSNPSGYQCTVINGRGTMQSEAVTNIKVPCSPIPLTPYTISVAANNLKGKVTLRSIVENIPNDELVIERNGLFAFPLKWPDGYAYSISITYQPPGQQCQLTNNNGEIKSADVQNIVLDCVDALVVKAIPMDRAATLSWDHRDGYRFDVYRSPSPSCDLTNYTSCGNYALYDNVTPPFIATDLANNQLYYFFVVANYGAAPVVSQEVRTRPNQLVPNGPVSVLAASTNGKMYLGGSFTEFSVPTGGGVILDAKTGALVSNVLIEGEVHAAVADGSGGWYIGGRFSRVNGVERRNFAHLLDEDRLDENFNIPVDDIVETILLNDNLIYIGGRFKAVGTTLSNTINGNGRTYLAAIDMVTKRVLDWAPILDGAVTDLYWFQGRLYIAGEFRKIYGLDRDGFAAFDQLHDLLGWNPLIRYDDGKTVGRVDTMIATADRLFVGGSFSKVNETTRLGLAAFDGDGNLDVNWTYAGRGASSAWVEKIALSSDLSTLYISGSYSIPSQGTSSLFDAIDVITRTTRFSLLDLRFGTRVTVMSTSPEALFTVYPRDESLSAIGLGPDRPFLWSTNLTPIYYQSGWINVLTWSHDRLFVGGSFRVYPGYGTKRSHLAVIDEQGGLLPWSPVLLENSSGHPYVRTMVVDSDTVYVAGFRERQHFLASIDETGLTKNWNPTEKGPLLFGNEAGQIYDINVMSSVIYLGGKFSSIGGIARNNVAAFDSTGVATNWNPDASGDVNAIVNDGTNIYLGGNLNRVSNESRNGLAIVTPGGNLIEAWNPGTDSVIQRMFRHGDRMYLTGFIYGVSTTSPSYYIMALDTVDRNTMPLIISLTYSPFFLATTNRAIIVGDYIGPNNDIPEPTGLAAYTHTDGTKLPWDPAPRFGNQGNPVGNVRGSLGGVKSVAVNSVNGKVYAAGEFVYIEGRYQPFFAELTPP